MAEKPEQNNWRRPTSSRLPILFANSVLISIGILTLLFHSADHFPPRFSNTCVCGGWTGYGFSNVANKRTRAVIWSRESAFECATHACFSSNRMSLHTTKTSYTESLKLETKIRETLEQYKKRIWQPETDTREIENRFKDATCSVVGGAPFKSFARARSQSIDAQQYVFRANLNVPLGKNTNSNPMTLPDNMTTIDRNLGIGTRTDMLFINHIALERARCFANLPKGLNDYLGDTILLLHMFREDEIDGLLECNERLHASRSKMRMFGLHPSVRHMNQILLAKETNTSVDENLGRIPFSTTGLTMLTSALALCREVYAYGFTGSTSKAVANTMYTTAGGHDLAVERKVMQGIKDCKYLSEDGLCRKLKHLE